MQAVQQELDAEMQAAGTPEEIDQLHQAARVEANRVVAAAGLSPEEYATIAQSANQDPELYAQIVALMQAQAPQ
jgi:hypothetical protein